MHMCRHRLGLSCCVGNTWNFYEICVRGNVHNQFGLVFLSAFGLEAS